jgi:uncharacterized protein YkwD
MRTKALIALAVALALCVPFMPHASAATEQEVAEALFRKINNKRAKIHSLARTNEWTVIVDEATDHSEYQAKQGKISHDGFNGRANRIQNAGNGINGVCENVAFVSGVTDLKTIVRTFYRGWDNSPPHHKCLFDEDFKTTWAGVGIARAGASTWYATYIGAQDSSPGST